MTGPSLPEGTLLTLGPGDWYPRPGETVTADPLHICVRRIHPAGEGVVYVVGHRPECSREDSDCVQPWCVEVIASVAALERAARP